MKFTLRRQLIAPPVPPDPTPVELKDDDDDDDDDVDEGYVPGRVAQSMFMTHLRQSGRTTRMFDEAITVAMQGHRTYVIMPTRVLAHHWENVRRRFHPRLTNLTIHGINETDVSINWTEMTLMGAHSDCRLFVDHIIIESAYQNLLLHLHRWDREWAG